MKRTRIVLRYLISSLALSAAFSLVYLAQQTSGASSQNAAAKSPAMDHISVMVADWTRARDYTKEYLDAMPEDGVGFKPTPEVRSFAGQFLHLANANFAFGNAATGAANPYQGKNLETIAEYQSKAALTKIVMESYDYVINSVKAMDSKKLGEPVKLFGRFDATRGSALAKGFEHQTHHRGQTTIYLRLKGVKPPNEKLF